MTTTKAKSDGKGAVWAALLKAQGLAKSLCKDARNDFHHYKYVSSEAMIKEAKTILDEVGLSVLPIASSIRDVGDNAIRILHRTYIVADAEGSTLSFRQEWPIVPEKGRPWDKATASSLTSSLNYFLRDLLLIPRADPEDDMDNEGRDRVANRQKAPTKAEQSVLIELQQKCIATFKELKEQVGEEEAHGIYKSIITKHDSGNPHTCRNAEKLKLVLRDAESAVGLMAGVDGEVV